MNGLNGGYMSIITVLRRNNHKASLGYITPLSKTRAGNVPHRVFAKHVMFCQKKVRCSVGSLLICISCFLSSV